jgi:hypothetical protein
MPEPLRSVLGIQSDDQQLYWPGCWIPAKNARSVTGPRHARTLLSGIQSDDQQLYWLGCWILAKNTRE